MHYPFQSTGKPISHRNERLRLHDSVPKLRTGVKFCSGTTTGVNSRPCDLRLRDILWWYHATRGNRSELEPARKSPRCNVNTPHTPSGKCLAPRPCEFRGCASGPSPSPQEDFLVCNHVTRRPCWGSKQKNFSSKNLHENRV